jgi:hypothetical protein
MAEMSGARTIPSPASPSAAGGATLASALEEADDRCDTTNPARATNAPTATAHESVCELRDSLVGASDEDGAGTRAFVATPQ